MLLQLQISTDAECAGSCFYLILLEAVDMATLTC